MPSSPCLHPLLGVLEGQRLLVIPRAPGHHPVLRVRSDPYLPEHTNTVTHTHTHTLVNHLSSHVGACLTGSPFSPIGPGPPVVPVRPGWPMAPASPGGPRSPVGPLEEIDIFVTYVHIRSHTYNGVCKISSRTFLGHNFTSRLKIKQYNNYIYWMWFCEIIGRDYVQKVQRARSALPLPLIQLAPTQENTGHMTTLANQEARQRTFNNLKNHWQQF